MWEGHKSFDLLRARLFRGECFDVRASSHGDPADWFSIIPVVSSNGLPGADRDDGNFEPLPNLGPPSAFAMGGQHGR
jgi:hypothetical protein